MKEHELQPPDLSMPEVNSSSIDANLSLLFSRTRSELINTGEYIQNSNFVLRKTVAAEGTQFRRI